MGPIFVVLMLHHLKKNHNFHYTLLKFIYSEKATKFCEIFLLLLTAVHTVKSKGKISQNFVAFSDYMNFRGIMVMEFKKVLKNPVLFTKAVTK